MILSKFKDRGIPISKEHEEKLMEWEIIKQRSMMNKSDPRTDIGSPKHGKVDPNNKPHVGGNTWAGGSGGSDTSGLGDYYLYNYYDYYYYTRVLLLVSLLLLPLLLLLLLLILLLLMCQVIRLLTDECHTLDNIPNTISIYN